MAPMIRSSIVGLMGLLVVLSGSLPASIASAEEAAAWTLQQTSGQVHVARSGFTPVSLTVGDHLKAGDWIETGPSGRAVLSRGEESIVVAPNSRIGLPAEAAPGLDTRILQSLGTILLNVKKRARQHFEVKTPYLAAVVKGTSFTVSVQDGRGVVHVVEGLVEVTAAATNESLLIRPGQTVIVADGQGPRIEGDRRDPAGEHRDSASAGDVVIEHALGATAVDAVKTTGGLIGRVENSAALETWLGFAVADISLSSNADLGGSGSTSLGLSGGLEAGGVSANLSLGAGLGGIDLGTSLNAGTGGLDLGASLNVGTGGLDLGASVSVGTGTLDIGASLGTGVGAVTAPAAPSSGGLGGLLNGTNGN